jgi:hypothetical protein
MEYNITKIELIDNRNHDYFTESKWWIAIFFEDGTDSLMAFNIKRDAIWFMNGGYKQFELK